MNYISFSFLILFTLAFACRLTIGRNKTETPYLVILLFLSLTYYIWHFPYYIFIILASTTIDYFAGLYIGKPGIPPARKKAALVLSLACNLGLLGYFKYSNFFLSELAVVLDAFDIHAPILHLNILLPMGISFYTFQSMSYSIDVYRGELSPVRSFWKFLLFVSFFPQLTAGPIVRSKQFLYQIQRRRRLCLPVFTEGGYLIIRGLFLKMVIADNCGHIVSGYWDYLHQPFFNSFTAAFIVVLFSCQIFTDFAGYSSIARGLAYLLGFRLPVNFNSPYIAMTFSEFWKRWHITLSQWLRDYLYIPLGGNRISNRRTYLNIFIVMFLGGLWHGAALTFIAWGLIHAGGLILERKILGSGITWTASRPFRFFWFLFVQASVLLSWIFFRSGSIHGAFAIIHHIFEFKTAMTQPVPVYRYALLIVPIVIMHLLTYWKDHGTGEEPNHFMKTVTAAVMLIITITTFGISNAFIYFQF